MKKVICFDLWNTLVRSDGTGASYEKALVRAGVPHEKVFSFVREHLMTSPGELGQLIDKMLDHFEITPSKKWVKREVQEAWQKDNASVRWMPEALSLLRNLRALGHELVLITNSTQPGWRSSAKRLGLTGEFDHLLLSWELGISKPDPRIWELVENKYPDIPKENFWMIGDREEDDLMVPNDRGWNTFKIDGERSIIDLRNRLLGNSLILILDVPIPQNTQIELLDLGFTLMDTTKASQMLCKWEGWQSFDPERTLILTPGGSPEKVLGFWKFFGDWKERWPNIRGIPATRIWEPGSDPVVKVGNRPPTTAPSAEYLHENTSWGINDVVILDDVVSSGETARALHQPWVSRELGLPLDARWHIVSWAAQRAANLRGFTSSWSVYQIGLKDRKNPINSISTLLRKKDLAENYTKRKLNPASGAKFLEILSTLRKEV